MITLLSLQSQAQVADSMSVARQIDSIIQVSRALTGKRDFEKALELNAIAEKITLSNFDRVSVAYGSVCFNYGRIYHNTGDYQNAEKWYLEAKDIRSRVLKGGSKHPDYGWCLNNLAILYKNMGHYEKAEPLYLEAIDCRSHALGKEHPDYASSLNNLAAFYWDMGSYEKAQPLYLEAKNIRYRALGEEHPDYASSLNNLAECYHRTGDLEKAEQYFLEAKDIRLRVQGKEHPAYAASLNNLANLYWDLGSYEKAESLYLEAKDIRLKALGNWNPDYAASLNKLAECYQLKGNYEMAEPLYREAKEIREKMLGKEHPLYALSLLNLARLYQITGRIPESSSLFLELCKLNRLLVERSVSFASENQIIAYLKTFNTSLAQFQSFTQQYPNSELLQESYNNALFFNGLTLENNRLLSRAVGQADSLTRQIYEKWLGCNRRLAKRYARPVEENKKIAEVEAEAEGYEKLIMRSLPALQQARKVPAWQDVRNHLKPGEAAVEFLHYPFLDPQNPDSAASLIYTALIIRPGWEAPKQVLLFEEKQLDSLLLSQGDRKVDYVAALYSIKNRGIIVVKKKQKTLYELIWKPIEKEMEGVTTTYFSPRGLLHRINLAAIPLPPDERGHEGMDSTLADKYHLIELGSTRQLIMHGQSSFTGNEAILFGGIRFDMDSTAIFAANDSLADLASRGPVEEVDFGTSSTGEQWNYLKWTEKEVKTLAQIMSAAGFSSESRTSFNATEEAFKWIGAKGNSPRILHIATHGFFSPDPKTMGKKQMELGSEVGFKASDNPLIRSGLLLAGANHAWKTGKPFKKGMENGILTAFEISHLNLSNTELVVLSACETGLGDIQGNEGVYGLQRAFKIAGAKYLIMSLWQVPDFQTQELMTTFYTKWLEEKMTIPDAFRLAQQEMREKYENPYFWAGFVLVE